MNKNVERFLQNAREADVLSEEERSQRKRFWIAVGAFIVILSLITGGIFWLTTLGGEDDKKYNISAQDEAKIKKNVEDFVKESGTWGLKNEKINNGNVMNIWYVVRQELDNNEDYYLSRADNYNNLRDKYIKPNSPAYFTERLTGAWNDTSARDKMASFKISSANADKITNVGYLDGSQDVVATIPVNIRSVETVIMPTATDSSWTGSFNQLSKTFDDRALINISKGAGETEWKITSVNDMTYPFLLSTWEKVGNNYDAQQQNMRKIKTYYGTLGKDYQNGISKGGKEWAQGE